MTGKSVKRVVIAGGGTAGWVAAAALIRQLGQLIEVVLVESDEIGTVGVGESTIPTSHTFHKLLGIDEAAFMRASHATFKLGISFENWGRVGDRYFHSFGAMGAGNWMAQFHHFWLEAQAQGFGGSLADYCVEYSAALQGRCALEAGGKPVNRAYHLDATAYARMLRALSESAGVTRIEGRIAEVRQDGTSGHVTSLLLDDGQDIAGDLFIDCTGFRALLIEGALETGFEDWSHWLPTDRAFAVQTEAAGPPPPYTRAMAHGEGWQWRIPLQHRVGNGLVFASEHLSEDAARDRLLGNLEGRPLFEPRLIRYRTGRRKAVWNRNVVALGLSAGFVEPLESTSIHLMKIAVTRLIQLFPFGGIEPGIVAHFNAMAQTEAERVRDFIILHYAVTERDDSAFWNRMRTMALPDSLAARLALFREEGFAYQGGEDLFRVDSWVQVLLGQRMKPRSHHFAGRLMPPERLRMLLDRMAADVAGAVAAMPPHERLIADYCATDAEALVAA